VLHLVRVELEVAADSVEEDEDARVAEVSDVVRRDPADVNAGDAILDRLEGPFGAVKRVVQLEQCVAPVARSGAPERRLQIQNCAKRIVARAAA
jgi:hypothetical protein